jgi:hypothetical protein
MEYTIMRHQLLWAALASLLIVFNVQAAGGADCPKVSDIKASPETDPSSYDDFTYTAESGGVKWVGSTSGTSDTYLEEKYKLVLDEDNSTDRICSYKGETVTVNNVKSIPYLRLTSKK